MEDIEIVIKISEKDWEFIKSTNGCRWSRAILEGVINGIPLNRLVEQESTTKKVLAVDCISRADARSLIVETFRKNLLGMTYNKMFKTLYEGIDELTPAIPQEPRKGEWLRMSDLSEQEDDRYKCSCCENVVHYTNKMNLYTFNSWCGRCGSDNSRHINYEVEE